MNRVFQYFLILIGVIFIGCISRKCKDASNLTISLNIEYSPTIDTLTVGDTLRVESEFANVLIDENKWVEVKLDSFAFFSNIDFYLLKNDTFTPLLIDNSQIVYANVHYNLRPYSNGSFGISIRDHNYDGEIYNFAIEIELRDTGLYHINTISDLGSSIGTSQQNYPGQCFNQEIRAEFKVNNSNAIDNNIELLHSSPLYENLTERTFKSNGGYAFYVKE